MAEKHERSGRQRHRAVQLRQPELETKPDIPVGVALLRQAARPRGAGP